MWADDTQRAFHPPDTRECNFQLKCSESLAFALCLRLLNSSPNYASRTPSNRLQFEIEMFRDAVASFLWKDLIWGALKIDANKIIWHGALNWKLYLNTSTRLTSRQSILIRFPGNPRFVCPARSHLNRFHNEANCQNVHVMCNLYAATRRDNHSIFYPTRGVANKCRSNF